MTSSEEQASSSQYSIIKTESSPYGLQCRSSYFGLNQSTVDPMQVKVEQNEIASEDPFLHCDSSNKDHAIARKTLNDIERKEMNIETIDESFTQTGVKINVKQEEAPVEECALKFQCSNQYLSIKLEPLNKLYSQELEHAWMTEDFRFENPKANICSTDLQDATLSQLLDVPSLKKELHQDVSFSGHLQLNNDQHYYPKPDINRYNHAVASNVNEIASIEMKMEMSDETFTLVETNVNVEHLNQHVKCEYDTDVGLYQCKYCDCRFKRKESLARHVKCKHDADAEVYHCKYCDYKSKNKGYVIAHLKCKHNTDAKVYQCMYCNYNTKVKRSFTRHVKNQHDAAAKLYECHSCDYKTNYKNHLNRHVKFKHDADAKVHKCHYCDYKTKDKSHLTEHMKCKHDTDAEVYQCKYCDYYTKLKGNFIQHVKCKHDADAKVYQCKYCDYNTKVKGNLIPHVKYMHDADAEVYQCKYCNYNTKLKGNLIQHVKCKHDADAKVYQCKYCNLKTKWKASLAQHMNSKHGPDASV